MPAALRPEAHEPVAKPPSRRWRLTDISAGAGYLETVTPFPAGTPVLLSIRAANSECLLDGVVRAYGGAYAAYARDELGFKTEMTYNLLASDISGKWDWDGGSGRAGANVVDDLRTLLALTPSFRLLIAHGYSDMVTPYAASRYVLDHLPPMGDPMRTQLRLYRGGHMLYLDPGSRHAFSSDAKAVYQEAP